jgi:GntR family transcriptional regulator
VAAHPDRAVDPTSRLPLWAQLQELIARDLDSGALAPGDALPTEAELCARHGVSRSVVRQAVGGFVAQGRLHRLRGKGTFVSGWVQLDERIVRPTLGFFDDQAAAGMAVSNDLVALDAVPADAALAAALAVAPGAPCIRLERIRRVDGAVTALMRSCFPSSLHPELLERLRACDFRHTSLPRLLEAATGVRPHRGRRYVTAVAADAAVAAALGVAPGAPLLEVESFEDDADGRRIEHSLAWHRADRTRLELESTARSSTTPNLSKTVS